MKKINVLYLLLFVIITSCDSDDGDNVITDSIIGQWQLNSIVFGLGPDEEPLDECEHLQIYEFKQNNTLNLFFDPSTFCDTNTITLNYALDGNILTTENDLGGETYSVTNNIQILNSTTLKFIAVSNNIDGDLPPSNRVTFTYTRLE
ncbi:lipocalin family protein [uncultured Winogradskyella sp.]|uniref:lipocalin family protein n=1 Tax=uncultured Winogradskyella sp. TaxID=395353 RepID=UPI002636C335|nr:lipocalin family protein [uncultured Winogradskyella sp.]